MDIVLVLSIIYGLFLLWHGRWFSKPLSRDEFAHWRNNRRSDSRDAIGDQARDNLRSFLEADDGKPFYMINLMQYRDKAIYPDGGYAEVATGRQANALYAKAVVRELIKRGSYPVFLSAKMASFLSAGEGTDFFEEVAIVRYRSRRDLMNMAASLDRKGADVHKWASLEKTVVVPTKRILLLDLSIIVPLLLVMVGLLAGGI